jgi:YVTN family beta-propeller protein
MSHPRSIFVVAALATTLAGRPGLALDAVDGYVFVPNRGSADVAVIDSRTDRLVARLPVGRVPHQVVVSDVAG